ncbi:hypothetical protein XENOCAPTIV_001528 [Xenoophorus captivus]|uniref:Uncharacterized protein n=1 Tax=Xenoophorus captivus TaxID=1517983 RepID=A0ABV0RVB9_9TELE
MKLFTLQVWFGQNLDHKLTSDGGGGDVHRSTNLWGVEKSPWFEPVGSAEDQTAEEINAALSRHIMGQNSSPPGGNMGLKAWSPLMDGLTGGARPAPQYYRRLRKHEEKEKS